MNNDVSRMHSHCNVEYGKRSIRCPINDIDTSASSSRCGPPPRARAPSSPPLPRPRTLFPPRLGVCRTYSRIGPPESRVHCSPPERSAHSFALQYYPGAGRICMPLSKTNCHNICYSSRIRISGLTYSIFACFSYAKQCE